MKKITFTILAMIMIFAIIKPAIGQEANENAEASTTSDYNSQVSLNAGFSLVGSLLNAISSSGGIEGFKSTSLPAIQINYDYTIEKWLSIGAAASFQKLGYEYTDVNDGNEFIDVDLSRLNIAFRPLFHYGNLDNFDLYSGLRIGYEIWSINANTEDYSEASFANGFSFQLVAFGMRGYFTDNFGANVELGIGSPHFISMGLNYRF
jgi:opacity protein-like surface antigen